MPYIGNTIRAADDYRLIDDISSGFDGNDTTFALQVAGSAPVPFPKSPQQVLISVNGVIQEPDPTGASGFNLVGTNIVFSSAPTNGQAFFGIIYATADYLNAGGTFPAGALGAPSITFTSDEDTGFYRKGSGDIGIVSNATEVANFDGDGLTISDSIIHAGDTDTKIRFSNTNEIKLETAGAQRLKIDATEIVFNDDGANTDFRIEGDSVANMFFVDAGNDRIGIGTNSPINNLHLHQNDSGKSILQFTNTTTGTGATDGLHVGHQASEDVVFWNHEDTDIKIASNNTERIRVKNDGKVGINIDDPLELVHMKGNLFITLNGSSANEGNGIKFQSKTGGFTTSYGAAIFGKRVGDTSSYLRFDTGGQSEKMRLDENGRLGIGTTSPAELLHLQSTANNTKLRLTQSGSTTDAVNGAIHFGNSTDGQLTEIRGYTSGSANSGYLQFRTSSNGSDVTAMTISTSGRVGIGTASPSQLLNLNAASGDVYTLVETTVNGGLLINVDGTQRGVFANDSAFSGTKTDLGIGAKGNMIFRTGTSGYSERMRIDSDGRVLIGTTSSVAGIAHHLQVVEPDGGKLAFARDDTTVSANADLGIIQAFGNDNNGTYQEVAAIRFQADKNHGTNDKPGRLVFLTTSDNVASATERMRIDSSGRVMMNTTTLSLSKSPMLEVKSDSNTAADFAAVFSANNQTAAIGISYNQIDSFDNNNTANLHLLTNGTERMRITQTGNLLIGTTNSDDGGAAIGNDFGFVYLPSGHAIVRSGSTSVSGASGIAYTAKFVDTGTSKAFRVMLAQTEMGSITVNSGGTAFNTSSDYRRKENVVELTGAITRLKTLLPKRFNFKDEPSVTRDGFLAHEVTAVPEAVYGTKDEVDSNNNPVYQQLDQSKLVPLLVAAVQELIGKVEALEAS